MGAAVSLFLGARSMRVALQSPTSIHTAAAPEALPEVPERPSGRPGARFRRIDSAGGRTAMDRETRLFAENYFRGAGSRLPAAGCPRPQQVDFIEAPDALSYADFVKRYLLPNVPCVFSQAFTESWGCRKRWVTPSGQPDWEYLLQNYGDVVVPVANCGRREYNSNPKEHMPLRDYISYWREYIKGGYSSPKGCLYLKDWHLCRDTSAEDVFTLPVYFSSDWLNEYWDTLDVDDYRFIYMGPTGSWSPFHADIFRSFSWSVNICGRKKWIFFPPGQEETLRDGRGNLPYDVTSPSLRDTCPDSSPPLEVVQEAGEMVFVPSGWHHQVHNLQDTISINHNWVNGCNLWNMWLFLQQELRNVQQEVLQWKDTMPDWHQHCQVIMRSCTGINFEEFYHFLKVIAERRLISLTKGMDCGESEGTERTAVGPQQAAFDISRIAEVLASVVIHPDFQRLDTSTFSPRPEQLLQQLETVVSSFFL